MDITRVMPSLKDALSSLGTDPTHFTGKERDLESGNDYFGARFYSSSTGRFMNHDPSGLYYADPSNPQSLNLYSYVQNNPLINIDPTGLDCVQINNDTGAYEGFERGDCDNSTAAKANSGYYFDGKVDTLYTSTGNLSGQVTGIGGVGDDSNYLLNSNPARLSTNPSNSQSMNPQIDPDVQRFQQLAQGVDQRIGPLLTAGNQAAGCVPGTAITAISSFFGIPNSPFPSTGTAIRAAKAGAKNAVALNGIERAEAAVARTARVLIRTYLVGGTNCADW